ncbi:MAG: hypothetical protein K940chlam9_00495 [Chlamydiae bacterium]|nr:hypothetical protein [Chlamydiota bacterium]
MDLETFCRKKIVPRGEKLDYDPKYLKKLFKKLGRQKLLALRAPREYGGRAFSREEYFHVTELLQSYSGAFGFFQRQHQAAAHWIAESEREDLKELWLPLMAKGSRKVGVSISLLRDPSFSALEGSWGEGGVFLKGVMKWVSGYRLFDHLVLGFFLPEEKREGMAIIPFQKTRKSKISCPLPILALSSLQTVSIDLRDYFVSEENILFFSPEGTFAKRATAVESHFVSLSALALAFSREVENSDLFDAYLTCREAFLQRTSEKEALPLYVEMNQIATSYAHHARYSWGSRMLICPNPIERRIRELLLFSMVLADPATKEALLEGLLPRT